MEPLTKTGSSLLSRIKSVFVARVNDSEKPEIQWNSVKAVGIAFVLVFVAVVMFLPNDLQVEFTQKLETPSEQSGSAEGRTNSVASQVERDDVWARPRTAMVRGSGSDINYNTPMVLGGSGRNAKTQVRAGQRLPLRIADKFIVSDTPVPILADLLLSVQSESGLKLPAGTKFYGEASFQKGQDRAQIRFTQISLPNGRIRSISGLALGKDGQPGVPGRVYSDGAKNTAGQVLTTFIGGLAAGSVETDMFGNSRGGVQNGLLSAVAATAKDRAQSYGEKLKTEREWIEVSQGAECDGSFDQSVELQESSNE